jgi:hypothetical protein
MNPADDANIETYNPWTVVNLVFTQLASEGLHPVLGESGDPGPPARALLMALGIEPAPEGNREVMRDVRAHLDQIRAVMFDDA